MEVRAAHLEATHKFFVKARVLAGQAHLHARRVILCDIKPTNFLVTQEICSALMARGSCCGAEHDAERVMVLVAWVQLMCGLLQLLVVAVQVRRARLVCNLGESLIRLCSGPTTMAHLVSCPSLEASLKILLLLPARQSCISR